MIILILLLYSALRIFSLVSAFSQKKILIKWATMCVCVCVCMHACVQVCFLCVRIWVCMSLSVCVSLSLSVCLCLCTVLVPPNNFHTSYAIDTKCWLHIVSYRNSPTPLIPFLNFENCAWEKFLKFIFSPFN